MNLLVQISFAVLALIGLYAALRPESYARHLLADWQHERLAGNLKAVSFAGWGIFVMSLLAVVGMSAEDLIRPHRTALELVALFVFAAMWLWWGISMLLKPQKFFERSEPWLPQWRARAFGCALVVGGIAFAYQFALRIKTFIR